MFSAINSNKYESVTVPYLGSVGLGRDAKKAYMQKYSAPSSALAVGGAYTFALPDEYVPSRNIYGMESIVVYGSSKNFPAFMSYIIDASTKLMGIVIFAGATTFSSIGTNNNMQFSLEYPLY